MINFVDTKRNMFITVITGQVLSRDDVTFFGSSGKDIKKIYKNEAFIILHRMESALAIVIPMDNIDIAQEELFKAIKRGAIYKDEYRFVYKEHCRIKGE